MYDRQIMHHNPRFNLFILHNNLFDNQGSNIYIYICKYIYIDIYININEYKYKEI